MKAKARIAPWGRITGVLCTVVLVTHGQECVFDRDCSDGDPAGRQDPAFNSGTGPIAGQTGAVTDQYIYLNSSGPSSSSRVSTPTLNLPNGGSFSFHYHMFGPEVLSLTVISTLVNGTAVPLFSISGQQHSSHTAPWTRVERDLHPNTTQVTWVASSLSVGGGDIGLDAIAISDTITGVTAAPTLAPTSRPTASGTVFQCSFDTPTSGSNPFLCGLTVSPRWGTTTGRTPSSNTGPNAGQFGLTDRYCFLEASSTAVVDQFVTSPTFVLAVPGHVTFFYHMFGSDMGNLTVESRSGTGSFITRLVFRGQQQSSGAEDWRFASVDLPAGTTQVRWNGGFLRTFRSDMAIDDINIAQGPAPSPVAPPTVPPTTAAAIRTVSGEQFSCDFTRSDRCGIVLSTGWRTVSGGSFSSESGPSSGRTFMPSDGYLLYDASVLGANATIENVTLPNGGFVSFFFHMFGRELGTLRVQQCISDVCTTVWSRSGQQHDTQDAPWAAAAVTLGAGTTAVRFVGDSFCENNLAIDEVVIASGTLPLPPSPIPPSPPPPTGRTAAPVAASNTLFSCAFDDTCTMAFTGRWTRRSGPTPSFATGPIGGEAGGADSYVYLEASSGGAAVSNLTLSGLTLSGPSFLSFYFHMFGNTMGTLRVEVSDGGAFTEVFRRSGEQHCGLFSDWSPASVALPSGTTTVRWVGEMGTSFRSDMAVDTITIARGTVPPSPPTLSPTSPSPTIAPSQSAVGTFSCTFDGVIGEKSSTCGMAITGDWLHAANGFCTTGQCSSCTGCSSQDCADTCGTSAATSSSDGGSSNAGVVIGVVIALLVVLLVIALLVARKRKERKPKTPENDYDDAHDESPPGGVKHDTFRGKTESFGSKSGVSVPKAEPRGAQPRAEHSDPASSAGVYLAPKRLPVVPPGRIASSESTVGEDEDIYEEVVHKNTLPQEEAGAYYAAIEAQDSDGTSDYTKLDDDHQPYAPPRITKRRTAELPKLSSTGVAGGSEYDSVGSPKQSEAPSDTLYGAGGVIVADIPPPLPRREPIGGMDRRRRMSNV